MAAEEDRETATGEEGDEFLPLLLHAEVLRMRPSIARWHQLPVYGSRSELLSNLGLDGDELHGDWLGHVRAQRRLRRIGTLSCAPKSDLDVTGARGTATTPERSS